MRFRLVMIGCGLLVSLLGDCVSAIPLGDGRTVNLSPCVADTAAFGVCWDLYQLNQGLVSP